MGPANVFAAEGKLADQPSAQGTESGTSDSAPKFNQPKGETQAEKLPQTLEGGAGGGLSGAAVGGIVGGVVIIGGAVAAGTSGGDSTSTHTHSQ